MATYCERDKQATVGVNSSVDQVCMCIHRALHNETGKRHDQANINICPTVDVQDIRIKHVWSKALVSLAGARQTSAALVASPSGIFQSSD